MSLTTTQTKKLLEYAGAPKLTQLALTMALTRYKSVYKAAPNDSTLKTITTELNELLNKFAMIMQQDYNWIVSL